ncbi:isoprenylcysteine carboxylmethyltransferase family protein [Paraburkholderia sp. A1RO-5]|uniref:methyltransferase family protein n=1 Tax=Paraburkholderia sp. A1RO-5 TaxID=3028369 RepID=UPI003B787092
MQLKGAAPGGQAGVTPESKPPLREIMLETSARTGTVLLLGLFAYNAIVHWRADPTRITLLLLVVSECIMVLFSLFSRVPARRDWTPFAFLSTIAGTYYFVMVVLAPGVKIVPEAVGVGLQIAGMSWQIFAKASLRRSFGLLPANRGVVSSGAYRVMRHPMYFGYFVTDIGFLLVNFGMQNMIVYLVQFALQAARIVREERLLSDDAQYREYKERVRYRVVPGLF